MELGACHECASGSNLAFHVDSCSQIHRVRICCGGQPNRNPRGLRHAECSPPKTPRAYRPRGRKQHCSFRNDTAPATTFRAQAVRWIEYLSQRRRKPAKPATISGWRDSLNKWVLPHCGDLQLAEVGNAVLKGMIGKLHAAGLSAQSIISYTKVIKMVGCLSGKRRGRANLPAKMEP
jgi:hypothetical protein